MTTVTDQPTASLKRGYVGQSIPRREDKRLVQGLGTFFDDVRRHGMGYVHFVRSPYAHARIISIDVSKALELEGVYGTITGDEVAIHTEPFFEMSVEPGGNISDYALAVGRVRHMGEPVAAVCAATRELARDAADLIEVEYDSLPVLVDAEEALKDDVVLHDEAGSNVVWSGVFDWGDVDQALAEADHVVKIERLHFHRFSSTPLECAGALVEYDKGTGEWTLTCNHQMPGVGAIWMAPALRTGIDKLRFVTHDIGGGFGNKICLHPQYVVLCLLARKLGRPVQWTEWRTDQHTANAHGNERTFLDVEVAVKADGDDDRLQGQGARRLWRVPALRAAGLHHLGAGDTGALRLAEHSRRLHPSLYQQVAGLAEPRLLAHAASLADGADHRHRRNRARPRSGRSAQAQLRQDGADALRDAERLCLRLRRLRGGAGHRARPHRPRLDRGAAQGGGVTRQASRLRHRLDPRLGDEQLRPVHAL